MRTIVRSTGMVAAAAGTDDLELTRSVLDELGHAPQIVEGRVVWLLDGPAMETVAEAIAAAADDGDDGDADDLDDADDDEEPAEDEA